MYYFTALAAAVPQRPKTAARCGELSPIKVERHVCYQRYLIRVNGRSYDTILKAPLHIGQCFWPSCGGGSWLYMVELAETMATDPCVVDFFKTHQRTLADAGSHTVHNWLHWTSMRPSSHRVCTWLFFVVNYKIIIMAAMSNEETFQFMKLYQAENYLVHTWALNSTQWPASNKLNDLSTCRQITEKFSELKVYNKIISCIWFSLLYRMVLKYVPIFKELLISYNHINLGPKMIQF